MEQQLGPLHVDDFVDSGDGDMGIHYARLMLGIMRMPAHGLALQDLTKHFRLFCTYNGERYRVVMASRMGDIGLSKNFEQDTGYSVRVAVTDCRDWSAAPCTCGSGGHPRRCAVHPAAYDEDVAELNRIRAEEEASDGNPAAPAAAGGPHG